MKCTSESERSTVLRDGSADLGEWLFEPWEHRSRQDLGSPTEPDKRVTGCRGAEIPGHFLPNSKLSHSIKCLQEQVLSRQSTCQRGRAGGGWATTADVGLSTRIFVAILFIIFKHIKQPKHPSIAEWINKLEDIHAMQYYSTIRRNELSNHEKLSRNCKYILLTERSQAKKIVYCMNPTIWCFGKGKTRNSEEVRGLNPDPWVGTDRWKHGDFWGRDSLLCDALMLDAAPLVLSGFFSCTFLVHCHRPCSHWVFKHCITGMLPGRMLMFVYQMHWNDLSSFCG